MAQLTIAIPKGRLEAETLELFAAAGRFIQAPAASFLIDTSRGSSNNVAARAKRNARASDV